MRGRTSWWALAAGAVLVTGSVAPAAPPGNSRMAPDSLGSEARIRNLDIEFYVERVHRDPRSARDYAQLAGLYLQRARETADNGDLLRAERNARQSLRLRTARNGAAFGLLASALLAQHRFAESRAVARRLVADDSSSIPARALLAETELELGDYAAAERMLGSLSTYREDLSVAPRLARWLELHGHAEEARRLLRAARDRARRLHGIPAEQLAWFDLRLGDLALRNGHLAEAGHELRKGLSVLPNDYRILGGLARLEASRGRWSSAIAYGERALASALDPATLGLVGDAYAALGDSGKAGEYYHTMEVAVSRQPGPFHRAWSLFLLDHGREMPRVLAAVQEEIQTRRDIYGYDLLAWALHRAGDDRQAAIAMDKALALGTRDGMLFYHAGMIALGRRDRLGAAEYLGKALEVNPYWDPFQPAQARAVLDSLARARSHEWPNS
jgi:tetratricopeptide (TPR) repeat protein